MSNTEESFLSKWTKNPNLAYSETSDPNSKIFQWILNRNGFTDKASFQMYLAGRERILDAGCGNGRVTALLRSLSDPQSTSITAIDLVAADVALKNLAEEENVEVFKKDLLEDLSDLGTFNFIYCQEVLHHTKNPRQAFLNLCSLLEPTGEIAIYVYKEKTPVREYVDDYVRNKIASLPYDEAMKHCAQITQLGKMLSEQNVTVNVPAVDLLEIPEGTLSVQRFIYHFFMKCFWNPEFSFHDNAVINYDWYHPQECTRHTLEEVREWYGAAGLLIAYEHVDHYGITVRGAKP